MDASAKNLVYQIPKFIKEHAELFDANEHRVNVNCFTQQWSDTSCGHGGMAGQAVTEAYTVVLTHNDISYSVFIGGRFAYLIEYADENFREDLKHHRLVGAKNYDGQYDVCGRDQNKEE